MTADFKRRAVIFITFGLIVLFLLFLSIDRTVETTFDYEKNSNAFQLGETVTITDSDELIKYAEKHNIPLKLQDKNLVKIESHYEGTE